MYPGKDLESLYVAVVACQQTNYVATVAVLKGDDRIWPGNRRAIFNAFFSAGSALETRLIAGDWLKTLVIYHDRLYAANRRITSKVPA